MAAGAEKAVTQNKHDGKTRGNVIYAQKADIDAGSSDTKIFYFEDKAEFFAGLDQILKAKDTILVKASHGMEFTEIIDVLEKH